MFQEGKVNCNYEIKQEEKIFKIYFRNDLKSETTEMKNVKSWKDRRLFDNKISTVKKSKPNEVEIYYLSKKTICLQRTVTSFCDHQ